MACGGCAQRQRVLAGMARKIASGHASPQQVAQRLGAVAKSMVRDVRRSVLAPPRSPQRPR